MLTDIIFWGLLIVACIKGYQKGLVIALFSVISLIIGLAAGIKLSAVVASTFKNSTGISAKWLPFIAFIIVLFIIAFLVRLVGKLIEKTFQAVLLGWINRLGGALLFALIYTVIFSVILFYCDMIHLIQVSGSPDSPTIVFLKPWGPKLINGLGEIIPVFKDMFRDLEAFFGTVSNKISY